jgi:outer membrane protein assembly factor BamB
MNLSMKRLRHLKPLFAAIILVAMVTAVLFPSILLPSTDLLADQYNDNNSSHPTVADSKPLQSAELLWSTKVGSVVGSAAASGARVIVGTLGGDIVSISSKTGSVLWKRNFDLPIASSSAISNGKIYFGTFRTWPIRQIQNDYFDPSPPLIDAVANSFYAVDVIDGRIMWNYSVGGNIISSPAVYEGIVYFGALDSNIYALEAQTGRLAWKTETEGAVWTSPSLSEGTLYVVSSDNYLYAMNAETGEINWKHDIIAMQNLGSSPMVSDGTVFVGGWDGTFLALDQYTGDLEWKVTINGLIVGSAATSSSVLVTSTDGVMYAFSKELGDLLWTFKADSGFHSSPVIANDTALVTSYKGKIYSVDVNTGDLKWSCGAHGFTEAQPVVVEGRVFIGSKEGDFYAIHT